MTVEELKIQITLGLIKSQRQLCRVVAIETAVLSEELAMFLTQPKIPGMCSTYFVRNKLITNLNISDEVLEHIRDTDPSGKIRAHAHVKLKRRRRGKIKCQKN